MKIYLFFLFYCISSISNVAWTQQYDLIIEMFKNSDTVFLQKEYYSWNNLNLNKEKVLESWNFQSVLGGPDSKLFERAFDVENFIYQQQEKYVNFKKLPLNFYSLDDYKKLTEVNIKLGYNIISPPIFNSEKNWAIIYHQFIWSLGSGSELIIYRKNCDGDWIKYYTITLSFS